MSVIRENPLGRGERVHFDFDSGNVERADAEQDDAPPPGPAAFVGDILERTSSSANPPQAPTFKAKTNTTGFPAHKKRANRVSAFKQQRTSSQNVSFTSQADKAPSRSPPAGGDDQDERKKIDQENNERIANMSAEEIEQERKELLSALSPSLIQRLLSRSNIDDGSNEQDLNPQAPPAPPTDIVEPEKAEKKANNKKVSFAAEDESSAPPLIEESAATPGRNTDPPAEVGSGPGPVSQVEEFASSVHFPKPPQPPELDPNSDTFLDDLHQKYFPDLPHDPASLSWMKPVDPSDTTSPYHPSQVALNASELRFDFQGALLAPSKAREIATTKGLHHHADAPEAAGYTVPELARLARSAVPTQRCIAYQTLGRVLYRLGQGEFGEENEKRDVNPPVQVAIDPNQKEEDEIADEEDAASFMATGLWNCIEEGKVIETLTAEAGKEKGHLTARTYAQEALWNWRRGGGRKRKAV